MLGTLNSGKRHSSAIKSPGLEAGVQVGPGAKPDASPARHEAQGQRRQRDDRVHEAADREVWKPEVVQAGGSRNGRNGLSSELTTSSRANASRCRLQSSLASPLISARQAHSGCMWRIQRAIGGCAGRRHFRLSKMPWVVIHGVLAGSSPPTGIRRVAIGGGRRIVPSAPHEQRVGQPGTPAGRDRPRGRGARRGDRLRCNLASNVAEVGRLRAELASREGESRRFASDVVRGVRRSGRSLPGTPPPHPSRGLPSNSAAAHVTRPRGG